VKGVLLYGMPGTGKTMLARAVAKECGCLFINVQRQVIDHHYYGESERLTAAVFSLAKKLQPVVTFIDEIDALLMNRQSIGDASSGSEVRKNQVSVMLSLWDGLTSSEKDRIIVIGATNLLTDLDPAALRRMPL
jgi:ATPase family AAA domain-containing protein 1